MHNRWRKLWWIGGCLTPSFFLSAPLSADTIFLKDGKTIKGLVVEEHADRVILSTEEGEHPVFLLDIREIRYDDPAQNFLQTGKSYEAAGKLGEALAYYEKAAELNPGLQEAKRAALGVRSRFWAKSTEGPTSEVEKQQALMDSWGNGRPLEKNSVVVSEKQAGALKQSLGLSLEKKGDWVSVASVSPKKDAALAGLARGDWLVSIDGESLRYLGEDAVRQKMLTPRFANFNLEFERNCFLTAAGGKNIGQLGLKLELKYQGIEILSVATESPAEAAGLKPKDLVVRVNGEATRYLPLGQVIKRIEDAGKARSVITVRRSALLTRK